MITIFTPTYNRAGTLPRLYNSLLKQTNHKFEWIIIDDGSVDNTEEVVAQFLSNNNSFEIVYKKKPNGGKHRAINDAVKMAKHDWFFIVDSDDFIVDRAIEMIISWIKTVEDDNSFAGVAGLKGHIDKEDKVGQYPSGEKYKEYIDATNLQRRKFKLSGDKAEVYRTAVLLKFPFPEFEGENFMSEAVVWDAIAESGYKLRWYNEVIYRCEYLEGGLTRTLQTVVVNNYQGFTYYTKTRIKTNDWLMKQSAIEHYLKASKLKGLSFKEARNNIDIALYKTFIPFAVRFAKKTLRKVKK